MFLSDSEHEDLAQENQKQDGQFIYEIGGPDNPIIFKMVTNPLVKDASGARGSKYVKVDYYSHRIGNGEKDIRDHPSLKSLGLGDSPEETMMWDQIKKMKTLKENDMKGTPDWKAVEAIKKTFSNREKYHILVVEPNSSKIRSLKVGSSVKDQLYGREGNDYRAAIPSLINMLQQKGLTPFLDKNPDKNKKGWLKLWKTGEGLGTRYFVELATEMGKTVVDGNEVEFKKTIEFSLGDDIQKIVSGDKALDMSTIPDIIENEKKNAWTFEESQKFVAALGSIVATPARFLKKAAGEYKEESFLTNDDLPDTGNMASMDDIPF